MQKIHPAHPELYTHVAPSTKTAEAFAELSLVDAVRHGLMLAQLKRDQAGVYHWLDRVEATVNERRATILKRLEGTGAMFASIDGHIIAIPFEGEKGAA